MSKFSRYINRITGTLLIALIFFPVWTFAESEKSSSHFTLDNGLEIFLYQKPTLPIINFVFAFNVGSKDESEHTNGIVHVLEHCLLFRGSKFVNDKNFSQRIRNHGAYYNAHTGRDIAIFEMSLPSEFSDFALQTLREILFEFDLKQQDLDNEKKIIIEELQSIKDDPYKTALSLIYLNLFQNHPYQNSVYGKIDVIQKLTSEEVMIFYNKYFVPSKCVLAVVGHFSIDEMEKKTKSILGDIKKKSDLEYKKFYNVKPLERVVEKEIKMDVKMGYLAIGLNSPGYNSKDQYAVDLLTEIFGRGFSPLLNQSLMNRRIETHSLEMSYFSDTYGGAIIIFIKLNPKHINAAESEIDQFLKSSRRLNYSKDDYASDTRYRAFDLLESAKNRIKFNSESVNEQGMQIGYSLVRYMLMNQMSDRGNYLDEIEWFYYRQIFLHV